MYIMRYTAFLFEHRKDIKMITNFMEFLLFEL